MIVTVFSIWLAFEWRFIDSNMNVNIIMNELEMEVEMKLARLPILIGIYLIFSFALLQYSNVSL
jgi:hypothetical protein